MPNIHVLPANPEFFLHELYEQQMQLNAKPQKRQTKSSLKEGKVTKENYWEKKYYEVCAKYEDIATGHLLTQADIRLVINKVLKAHNLPSLTIKRGVGKAEFLSAISNHLWEVINVPPARGLSELSSDREGSEG